MTTWLSIASKQSWGRDGGSFTRAPSIICLHSTEGGSWPGYNAGADAPHFTINSKTGEVRQHTPLDRAGRALMHPAGTPETNRAGVIQVEIIGTCDGATASRYNVHYLPDMSDAEAANIRALLDAIHAATGIPLTTSVSWKQYPGSYGANGVRLSRAAFASYTGVLGHMHVSDNDHGDPGNLPIAKILSAHTDAAPSRGETRPPVAQPVKAAPKPVAVKAPKFPLPSGYYFGPKTGPAVSVSGYFSHRADLKAWQSQMVKRGWKLGADGLYGDATAAVVRSFQAEKGLAVDGKIGPGTWAAAWTTAVS